MHAAEAAAEAAEAAAAAPAAAPAAAAAFVSDVFFVFSQKNSCFTPVAYANGSDLFPKLMLPKLLKFSE